MDFQTLANMIENDDNFPNSITVEPYVYRHQVKDYKNSCNTIVFEYDRAIITLHENGSYEVEQKTK